MLNEYIKKEARDEFKKNYRDSLFKQKKNKQNKEKKIECIIIAGGKFGRKLLRKVAKAEIKKNKGQLESPLGKMRNRQERKEIAKSLKIPFTPRYNGAVYKLVHEPYQTKKGYTKYKSTMVEVAQ